MAGFCLLTTGNRKTVKGEKSGYLTFIMHLAPHTVSGFNTCPGASAGCSNACLNTAGRGVYDRTQLARVQKTQLFMFFRDTFMDMLVSDVEKGIRQAERRGMIPVFRLNGTSDIRWETVPVKRNGQEFPNIMTAFPTVQFYDYTKLANRKNIPANYHLTFSLSESNEAKAIAALATGMSVAVVFRDSNYPKKFMGKSVVSGDDTDLRFLDPKGVVVGLKAKGRARKDYSGFVRETAA